MHRLCLGLHPLPDARHPQMSSARTLEEPLRILIMDPDPEVAKLLADTLRAHGYSVGILNDAARAWAVCSTSQVDLVLLDPLSLVSWRRGLALCQRIHSSTAAMVVLVTTRTLASEVREGL